MERFPRSVLLLLTFLSLTSARAHHGQDFLLLQDYQVPSVWSGSAYSGFDWSHYGGADESGVETGIMIGIAPRLALGANVEFSDAQGGWGYSSVMPYLHLQLTPPQSRFPVRVALQAGYQFAATHDPAPVRVKVITPGRPLKRQATTSTVTTTIPTDTGGGEDPGPCGPEYGPDAPPCPVARYSLNRASVSSGEKRRHANHVTNPHPTTTTVTKSQTTDSSTVLGPSTTSFLYLTPEAEQGTGIHRHGESFFTARLILEADLSESDKVLVNFINVTPENGKPAWGYAAGLRHSFNHEWATGLEAIGDIGSANEHEIVLGGYYSPRHNFTVKVGVGIGLTSQSPDVSLRTGIVYRF